ncbi:hypothetical protein D3C74_499610 [compost metagenome]
MLLLLFPFRLVDRSRRQLIDEPDELVGGEIHLKPFVRLKLILEDQRGDSLLVHIANDGG